MSKKGKRPSQNERNKRQDSTLAALLKQKPRRGRPPRAVSRQNVYVALSDEEKQTMKALAERLPGNIARADIADLAITLLSVRLEELRRAVSDRSREFPEGVTDIDSLYLLWDLPLPASEEELKWTSIRVSPQQAIELGRMHGTLNALFGATRSEVYSLGLALLGQFLNSHAEQTDESRSLLEMQSWMANTYL